MNAPNDNFQDNIETIQTELVTGEHEAKIAEKIGVEEFSISGDALGGKIKELIHQGNIRRIIIKNEQGHTLIEIPLTVGVVGGVISAALFPVMAAVGSIGAMVAHLTIGETPHQSCLLLTSREKPREITLMEGRQDAVFEGIHPRRWTRNL
jgi:hypothetical protein